MAKILVVDDDEQIRYILSDLLTRMGSKVEEASDGEEALKMIKSKPFDLIIMDILMPGKEGIQTIQELKKEKPQIKIIAISGGGHIGPKIYLDMASKMGADLCLSKPFDMQNLSQQVKTLLAEKSAH